MRGFRSRRHTPPLTRTPGAFRYIRSFAPQTPSWRSHYILAFPFVTTVFLIFSERVSLPRHLGRLVNVIASASLFIYLCDHQVEWVLEKTPLAGNVLEVPLAVAVGVVAWKAWEMLSAATYGRWITVRARATTPASP